MSAIQRIKSFFLLLYYMNSYFSKTHVLKIILKILFFFKKFGFFLDKLESLKELECLTVRRGVETGFIFTGHSKCCLMA